MNGNEDATQLPEDEREERKGIWIDEHIERSVPRIAGDDVRILSDEDAQDKEVNLTSQEEEHSPVERSKSGATGRNGRDESA